MKNVKGFTALILCIVMLTSLLVSPVLAIDQINVDAVSNGNHNSTTYNNGVFSAIASGSGLFAIALYKDDELVKLSFSESKEELTERRLNMMLDEIEGTTMKIFRFDEEGNPLCVNGILTPEIDNTKIYFNETFDNNKCITDTSGTTFAVSFEDGRAKVTAKPSGKFGPFKIPYPEKHIIVEADYEIPSSAMGQTMALISTYPTDAYKPFVFMYSEGLKTGLGGDLKSIYSLEKLKKKEKFNLALKIDLEKSTYDIFIDRIAIKTNVSIGNKLQDIHKTEGFSLYFPYRKNTDSSALTFDIYVDNIRCYSGTEWKNISKRIANVHAHDFKNAAGWESSVYQRPEADELAKKILSASHPRVLINRNRVEEIKNSNDEKIKAMRESVISLAESYLSQDTYTYSYTNTGSIEDVRDAMTLMMNLGMAYLLTGNTDYSDRAYKEAEVLFDVKSTHKTPDGGIDYWNSYSYLNVSEISAIMAICYDWMYDAWTYSQKEALARNTLEKGILRSYRGIYNETNPTTVNPTDFTFTNNWGAVCNGDMLMASVAFMEAEPHMCSQLAEANIRALEHFLPSYAPSGAWAEGASYWAYALKHLTYAMATLESSCGTDYGLSNTQGLEETQLYSLASEGKVGVVNYGDVSGSRVNAPFMFYWAKKFNNPGIGGAAAFIKNEYGYNYGIADLIYYDPAYVSQNYEKPLSFYYSGTELVTFASNAGSDGSFVSIAGGKGVATSHDHLDSGSIIAEKNGVRIICDTGAEHYGAIQYFDDNRYWYYKARPEGHNIFVINPQNLTNGTDSNYYHGQSKTTVSKIISYSSAEKNATMDLSDAYSRDAKNATRKISLIDDSIVIEDEITVISDGSLIEWYYHFKDTATAVVDNTTKYSDKTYCVSEISEDRKSVKLTFYDYSYNNGFKFSGTSKSFKLSFQTDEDYEIEIRDAVRNTYDSQKVTDLRKKGKLSVDYYPKEINIMNKIVIKMSNASGTVKLKTIIE